MNPTQNDKSNTSQRLGRYVIERKLTTGGMAELFDAYDPSADRHVVIKRILNEYSDDEDFITMFLNEAKLSVSLRHPNIVEIFDFGNTEGSYFLAMEFIFGKDLGTILRHVVEQQIHIPIDIACYMAVQMCHGLDYAHTKRDAYLKNLNIVHRDISPPNLMVSFDGTVKILDFGIAKATASINLVKTRAGVLKGKFCYMSPEQAYGKPLDGRTDIFSTAIVLYEMLTSRSLFYRQDEIETLELVRKAKVDPPSHLNPTIPPKLDKLLLKALHRKPRKRYASALDFATALEGFLKDFSPETNHESVAAWLQSLFPKDFLSGSEVMNARTIRRTRPPSAAPSHSSRGASLSEDSLSGDGLMLDDSAVAAAAGDRRFDRFRKRTQEHMSSFPSSYSHARNLRRVVSFGIFCGMLIGLGIYGYIQREWIGQMSERAERVMIRQYTLWNYTRRGNDFFVARNYKRAVQEYRKAARLDTSDRRMLIRLSIALLETKRIKQGCQLISSSEAKDVDDPLFHLAKGKCFERRNKKRLASRAFKQYLKMDPLGSHAAETKELLRRLD